MYPSRIVITSEATGVCLRRRSLVLPASKMIGAQINVLDYRAYLAGTEARADTRGLFPYGIGDGSRKRASPAQGLDRFFLLGCMPGNQCRLRGLPGHDRERHTFTLE